MPDIPKTQVGLIQHTRATAPLTTQAQLKYYDDGSAENWAKLGKVLDRGVSALAEFQRQSEETENNLSAAEAKNLYLKLNSDLDKRMGDNPGAFDQFEAWSKETDGTYAKEVKPYLDRMTPEFRKQFELDMEGRRIMTNHTRRLRWREAQVTANYNRFQALFKDYAVNNHEEAIKLLNLHRGKLINEQEYKTKMEIDLPRIAQSAEARRLIDANADGIIQWLEVKNNDGVFQNYPAITPEHRRELINYAKAKDSQRRADENVVFLDQLHSGKIITAKDVEESFAGKTSPEDLRQKQEQLKMVGVFESNRKKAVTAAREQQREKSLNEYDFKIHTFQFSNNEEVAKEQFANLKREIIRDYAGDMKAIDRLESRLNSAFKAYQTPKNSYRDSALYKEGEVMVEGMKAQGMFFAGGNKNANTVTASYVEKMIRLDLDNYVKAHPEAKTADLQKFLTQRTSFYNESDVAQIANMQFNEGIARAGDRKNNSGILSSLKPGTVSKGYVFQGGDPADKNNWKKEGK